MLCRDLLGLVRFDTYACACDPRAGGEVTDDLLSNTFSAFPSFVKARVVRDKKTNKTKGFGFAR